MLAKFTFNILFLRFCCAEHPGFKPKFELVHFTLYGFVRRKTIRHFSKKSDDLSQSSPK